MELHELLGRAKSGSTMALAYLENALTKAEKEKEVLCDRNREGLWDENIVEISDFIEALEVVICDLKHAVPQIQILMEDL